MARNRPAHVASADTVLHYKGDEVAAGGYTTALDNANYGGTPRFLTWQGTPPPIRQFGAAGTRGRLLPNNNAYYATRAGDATVIAALLGAWTTQAWIVPLSIGAQQTIWGYAAAGETEATNYLGRMVITSGGRLNTFWETGPGTNVNASQTAGSPLVVGVPQHIAIRKRPVGDGTFWVDFLIGGVLVETVGPLANASGGTSGTWFFGRAESAADPLHAILRSVTITPASLSDSVIAANAARGVGSGASPEFDFMQQNGTADLVHWWLNEQADCLDSGPLGFHLRETVGGGIARTPPIVGSSGGATTGSRTFGASGSGMAFSAQVGADVDPAAATIRAALLGEWTLAGWMAVPTNVTTKKGIACFGEAGFESTEPLNFLLGAEVLATRGLSFGWERDLGVNETIQAPADTIRYHEGAFHFALVKRPSVAFPGKWKAEIWIDETLIVEGDDLANGTGGTQSVFLLGDWNTGPAFSCGFDDLILESRAWEPAEIRAAAGVPDPPEVPDPDVTAPVVTWITQPTRAGDRAVLEVVDEVALRNVILFAILGDGSKEWVYDGATFAPRYSKSSRITIAGGLRFELERSPGGWPSGPLAVEARAFDTGGNEG